MGNILLFILAAYVIYYAANIIYDLFFDKEMALANQDEGQLVNMKKDDETPTDYDVDAVENVEAPSSFDLKEENLYDDDETPTDYDADAIRKNYEEDEELVEDEPDEEEEQDSDEYEPDEEIEQDSDEHDSNEEIEQELLEQENQEKKHIVSQLIPSIKTQTAQILSSKKQIITNAWDDDKFDDFLSIATSHVVLASNIDGHKVFKSTLLNKTI